jgi:hypothetical protein
MIAYLALHDYHMTLIRIHIMHVCRIQYKDLIC